MERLNVPLQLAKEMIRSGKSSEMRLFCAIKIVHKQGQVRVKDFDPAPVMEIIGMKSRTHFWRLFHRLEKMDWIGNDGTWYLLRSFKRLNRLSKTNIQLTADQLRHFTEAVFSAWVQFRIRLSKALQKRGKRNILAGSEYLISCSVIANEFGISRSTASRIKQRSDIAGFIRYRHRYKRLGVPSKYWMHFNTDKVVCTVNGLFERMTDFIISDSFYFKSVPYLKQL